MGDEGRCGHLIPFPVVQRFLTPVQLKRLLEASFLSYLDRHSDQFSDCPSLEFDFADGIHRYPS